MIPIMEQELVDRRGWLTREEFLDYMSLSQAMPGVFAVNMATCVGRRLGGMKGVLCAVLGNILFHLFRDNVVVDRIFMGLRPAVVALIAAPVFRLAKSAKLSWSSCWIPIVAALLIWLFDVSPIWIVLAAIGGGMLWGVIRQNSDNSQSSNVGPSR